MNQLIYFVQIVLYSGFFALVYRLMLASKTAHYFNRRFLVAAMVLPFILPALQLPAFQQPLPATGIINLQEFTARVSQRTGQSSFAIRWPLILQSIYWFIAICVLLSVVARRIHLMSILRRAPKKLVAGKEISILAGSGPGSFNGQIFFPDENIDPLILRHEEAHVRHRHHYDLWLIQLTKAFGWANPFVYYLTAQLKMVHEYEADAAIGDNEVDAYANTLLAQVLGTKQTSITHAFFHHPIKNRILMLQKQQLPQRNSLIKVAATAAILLFSGTVILAQTRKPVRKTASPPSRSGASKSYNKSNEVYKKVSVMPEFDGDVSQWLSGHLIYPAKVRNKGGEGKVIVQFIVAANGDVVMPKVVRPSGHDELDAEAMRVIAAMPKWKPGKEKGRNVNVYFNLPITFRLE